MTIKKPLFLLFFLGAVAANVRFASAGDPETISTLSGISGQFPGTVLLTWTAPADVPFGTVARYLIRYSPTAISTDADFDNASPINSPNTLNIEPPTPSSPGGSHSLTLSSLSPGVTYYFAIKSQDLGNNTSALSNVVQVKATALCSGVGDGLGSVSVSSPTIKEGTSVIETFIFTTNAAGIATGGAITMRVPSGFANPQMNGAFSQGYITVTGPGGAVVLNTSVSGAMATIQVVSGSLSGGQTVTITYRTFTCTTGTYPFTFAVRGQPCGVLTDAATKNVVVTLGDPQFVGTDFYMMPVLLNTVVPVQFRVRDNCGQSVATPSNINMTLDPVRYTSGSGFISDSSAIVGSNSSGPSGGNVVTIPATQNSAIGYYKITSNSFKPNNYLKFSYLDPVGGVSVFDYFVNVIPLTTGITNSTVDTGAVVAGQKTLTFTPDGDGSGDSVFINFTLPDESMSWTVSILKSAVIQRQFFGSGSARINWDGYININGAGLGAPGTYTIKIELSGGSISDTSLSAVLAVNGVTGRVKDDSSNILVDAEVRVFGPTSHFTRTRADGTFEIYGLRSSSYQIEVMKSGYARSNQTFTATGVTDFGDIVVAKQSVAQLTFTRPAAAYLPEITGFVNAHNSDWSKYANTQFRFPAGQLASDAGDTWNATPTPYSELTLAPNVQYTLEFNIEGLGLDPELLTLNAGETRPVTYNLVNQASISGLVRLPVEAGGVNQYGMWISVQAENLADRNIRRWGGVWIPAGELTATYRIMSVPNGSYRLTANVPDFVQAQLNVSISGNVSQTGQDFPTFSRGGNITGTLSFTGDTTPLDTGSGKFNVSVNAWSNVTQIGSYRSFEISVNPVSASSAYSLTGLADGDYEVYVYMPGFEKNPPGQSRVTVNGGSGTLNLDFQQFGGKLTGTMKLPGANSDYTNVRLQLLSFDVALSQTATATNPSAGTYEFAKLGTGYYTLRAVYTTTGFTVEKPVRIINGQTTSADLDLSGATYSISGAVTSSARAPYTLIYTVDGSSPTSKFDSATNGNISVPANTIYAQRRSRDFNQGGTSFDSNRTYRGTWDRTTGAYTIPNLTPGSYLVFNSDEMDGSISERELAREEKTVNVINQNVTGVNFNLTDGFTVSGSVRTELTETGRPMNVILRNKAEEEVLSQFVFLTGTSVDFTLTHIPVGDYLLTAEDQGTGVKKYSAEAIRVQVKNSDLTSQTINLLRASKLQFQLQLESGVIITSSNKTRFLPDSLEIAAVADPWFSGGYYNNGSVDSDGKYTFTLIPGKYRLRIAPRFTEKDAGQGKIQFGTYEQSGISVLAGETKDLGTIELKTGVSLKVKVTDPDGVALANIPVEARARNSHSETPTFFTDLNGECTLYGLSKTIQYYDIVAAARPDAHDGRASAVVVGYAESRRSQVDVTKTTSLNFKLQRANATLRFKVETPDGGELIQAFDDQDGEYSPGASYAMNLKGVVSSDSPLGEIEGFTDIEGNAVVQGLAPGSYRITFLSKNYGSVVMTDVSVKPGDNDLGAITLKTGSSLSGTITTETGGAVSETDLRQLIAVSGAFESLSFATLIVDAAGNISSYDLSGLDPTLNYTLLGFNEADQIMVLGSGIFSSNVELNLTLKDAAPRVFTQASKQSDGIHIRFTFTKDLLKSPVDSDNNGTADTEEGDKNVLLTSGLGTLTTTNWLSADRERAEVVYVPAAADNSFKIKLNISYNKLNSQGANYTDTTEFTYFVGIGKVLVQSVSNASGGTLQLPDDTSEVGLAKGFAGTDATQEHSVTFRVADDADVAGQTPNVGVFGAAKINGLKKYPGEMSSALVKGMATEIDPFSSFYDIVLPAGVRHSFPKGSEMTLCLAYNSDTDDPYSLNIYYYNPETDEYLIENNGRTVDTENERICAQIGHASVFTVLNSSDTIIAGGGYTGELSIINFPNPFNLKTKSVTLRNPGSQTSVQTITGTMIKLSVPAGMTGDAEIEIFNVAGEKVRTINVNVPTDGTHYYLEWDGKNDHGENVSSGSYVARFRLGGGNERFFKMAVIK